MKNLLTVLLISIPSLALSQTAIGLTFNPNLNSYGGYVNLSHFFIDLKFGLPFEANTSRSYQNSTTTLNVTGYNRYDSYNIGLILFHNKILTTKYFVGLNTNRFYANAMVDTKVSSKTYCKDGTTTSSTGRGTCSSHGGVADRSTNSIRERLVLNEKSINMGVGVEIHLERAIISSQINYTPDQIENTVNYSFGLGYKISK